MKEKEEKNMLILFLKILIILLVISGSIVLWARFIGTTGLKVKEYKIVEKTLPNEYHGLKIVHLSDIHYKTTINKIELEEIVKKVNLTKPDIVVITGDLFDKKTEYSASDFEDITNELNKIEATTHKYAIMGNHDFYVPEEWKETILNSGFIDLNNKIDLIYINNLSPILINGMSSDLKDKSEIEYKLKNFTEYIEDEDNTKPIYKIMIMHEPDAIDEFDYNNFDLILAGHSHNGQIRIPIIGGIYFPAGCEQYNKPYYDLNGTNLYISSGIGTSMLKLRLFNKPSFNLYRITNK